MIAGISSVWRKDVKAAHALVNLLKTSCATVSRTAFVAVAFASPTPKPAASQTIPQCCSDQRTL